MRQLHKGVIALGLISMAALWMGQAQPAPKPASMTMAVVDIVDLFDKLIENSDVAAELDRTRTGLDKQKKALADEVEKMQKELENPQTFKRDSPQWKQLQDDLLKKAIEYQTFAQFAEQKLLLDSRMKKADLYRKMNTAIEEYSKANGIAIVFMADSMGLMSTVRTPEQFQMFITTRKVIYFDNSFDITKAMILKMNSDYQLKPKN